MLYGEVLTAAPPHPGSPSVTFRLVRPTNAGTKNARSLARSASPRGCPLGGRYDGAKVHASSLPHRCCLVLRPADADVDVREVPDLPRNDAGSFRQWLTNG